MKEYFSDEQLISIPLETEAGVSAYELCRNHAISDAIFYSCRKKFGGMKESEVKRPKSPEKRTPASRLCSPKPCWIKKCYRWLWAKNSHDRPETGSHDSDV